MPKGIRDMDPKLVSTQINDKNLDDKCPSLRQTSLSGRTSILDLRLTTWNIGRIDITFEFF